ncbi:hypothetical protein D1872_314730 [compost metagenome]
MRQPVSSSQRSAVALTSAVPPELVTFSAEKSSWRKPGWSISATNSVFRPSKAEKRHLPSSLMKPEISRGLVISTLWLPVTIMHMQFAVKA